MVVAVVSYVTDRRVLLLRLLASCLSVMFAAGPGGGPVGGRAWAVEIETVLPAPPVPWARSEAIHTYLRDLAALSPRVDVETWGRTTSGQEIVLARISAEENLRRIDALLDTTARLADPRTLTPEGARMLAGTGRPFYLILGGIDPADLASPAALLELIHYLSTDESEAARKIRDELVVLIVPVLDPASRGRLIDWLEARGSARARAEGDGTGPPFLERGPYLAADNRWDGASQELALSRVARDIVGTYHPQVVHDLHLAAHEGSSRTRLWISTALPAPHGTNGEPVRPAPGGLSEVMRHALGEVTRHEWTAWAHRDAAHLIAHGVVDVEVARHDLLGWPESMLSLAWIHHAIGRAYGLAPVDLHPDRIASSLEASTRVLVAAFTGTLTMGAEEGRSLLDRFAQKSRQALDTTTADGPHAWVLPPEQADPEALARLINALRGQGIEVHRLTRDFDDGEFVHPAFSYVVRADQPYGTAARALLARDDGRAATAAGVAWPSLFGVQVSPVMTHDLADAHLQRVLVPVRPIAKILGEGRVFVLRDTGQAGLLAAAFRLPAASIQIAEESFRLEPESPADARTRPALDFPAGSWIVDAGEDHVRPLAGDLGLTFVRTDAMPAVRTRPLELPRIGVLHTDEGTEATGWTRLALDRAGVPYQVMRPKDLARGRADRCDVVVYPTPEGPVEGVTAVLGPEVSAALLRFIEAGGIVVAWGAGGRSLIGDHLSVALPGTEPARGTDLARVTPAGTPAVPEPVLTRGVTGPRWVSLDHRRALPPGPPPAVATVPPAAGPAPNSLDPGAEPRPARVIARLDTGDAAITDVPLGRGHLVFLGFSAIPPGLAPSGLRFVYNALLNWDRLPSN